MLEVKNLNKTYKTKKGVKHQAIKNVSLKFEETGMVYILGKSGSGKSTLLNLLGGLDSYDSGEIIIKGKSSKKFRNRDFDSYRNTYIGFIFQEFYVMEDFSVEQNIGLALKLQHRRADKETVDEILRKVDLEGYGQRKPNELSGGQKQRVAIARALVKNPQVIMADEPTGSLDSATGRQVFETLKKLSKEKLVLVVSHDREAAEQYGDRIIELSDGEVTDDVKRVSYDKNTGFVKTERYEYLKDSYIHVKNAKALTKEDMEQINKMLLEADGEVFISIDGKVSGQLYREYRAEGGKAESSFVKTEKAKNDYKQYDPKDFKLIKSKLPFKEAFLMGASGLKRKRIRLAFTIILSIISLVLFGVSDAIACYDNARVLHDGLAKAGITRVGVRAYQKIDTPPYKTYISLSDELADSIKNNFNEYSFFKAYNYSYFDDINRFINRLNTATGNEDFWEKLQAPYYQLFQYTYTQCVAVIDPDNSEMALASDEIMITEYLASFIVDLTSGIYEDTSDLVGTILNIAGANLKVAGIVDIGLDEIEDLDELKQPNSYNNSYNKLEGIVQSQEMIYASPQILEYLDLLSLKVTGQYDMAFSFSLMPISALDEDEINFSAGKNYDNFSDEDFVAEYYLYAFYNSFFSAISTEVGSKVDEEIKDAFDSLYEGEKDTDEYNQALRMFSAANFDTFYEQLAQEFIDDNYDGIISQISGFNPGISLIINFFNQIDFGYRELTFTAAGSVKIPQQEDEVKSKLLKIMKTGYSGITFYIADSVYDEHYGNTLIKPGEPAFLYFDLSGNSSRDIALLQFVEQNNCEHVTPISTQVYSVEVLAEILKNVFFYVSLVFCGFSGLLLMTFISASVSYKKKEIGILRALGSRQVDVFFIFACEGLLIAAIELFISIIGAFFLTNLLSTELSTMLIDLMNFNTDFSLFFFTIRQALVMAALAVGVVIVASFIPVKKIASMKPVDAIKDK